MDRCANTAVIVLILLSCLGSAPGQAAADTDVSPGALPGLRISVTERGMYRLSYEALKSAGAPVDSLNPMPWALWHGDEPVALDAVGLEDGSFDPGDALIFYGEPYVGRYMTRNVYRLTWAGAPGLSMITRRAPPMLNGPISPAVMRRARVELNRVYYSAYEDLARDADHLFDNPLYPNCVLPTVATTYTLDLPDLSPFADATVTVVAHGGRDFPDRSPDQSLRVRLNGVDLGHSAWDGSVTHVITRAVSSTLLRDGGNKLTLEAGLDQLPGIDYYSVSPDWVEIAYPAAAQAVDDRLYTEAALEPRPVARIYLPWVTRVASAAATLAARASGGFDVVVDGFATRNVRVYDVTDSYRPIRLTDILERDSSGSRAAVFAGRPDTPYALTSDGGLLAPAGMEYDAGSNLRATGRRADYIAIVHRSLWDAIQPLLDHRASEGMAVAWVDVQDIYDEFSGGMADPEAIRAFLAFAHRNWNAGGSPPQYVLLVGDGHYDFKGELRPGAANLIPPYLLNVDPTIGETAADNRYADVDEDLLPDMALGRIPARTPAEVTAVVDKILAYETGAPEGDWQRRAVFVADAKDDPAGNFHALSEQALRLLPSEHAAQAIYYRSNAALDTAGEMKAAIRSAFDGGALYVQWFGHAARASWSNERVWELNDPARLERNTIWPFTAHYSCWSGYFINIIPSAQYGNSDQSLGEALLLAPQRGSLADFSPSGLHVGEALEGLNRALIEAIFVDRIDRVGKATDAARKTYLESASGPLDVIDTQVLLGDPATRLKLP